MCGTPEFVAPEIVTYNTVNSATGSSRLLPMILLTQLQVPLDCIVTYDTVNSATGSSRLLPMILLTQLLVPLDCYL